MSKAIALRISALLIAASWANAETVTVRSGNGPIGGTDSAVTFLLGPPTGNFGHAFTPSDFSSAQSGSAAFVVPPNPLWISALSADASSQWIGSNPNAGLDSGNTALYAISFQITSPFSTASLRLNWAADDGIGDAANTGVYLNGNAVCGSSFPIGFSQEHDVNCDVGSALHIGTNWFFIENGNAEGPAGLIFSATITTTASTTAPTNFTYVPIPGTNNIQTHLMNTFPTGTFIANNALATPFSISSAPGSCGPSGTASCNYYDGFGPSGNGLSITLNVLVANPTDVYTLMNAYSPAAGEQLATITFLGTGRASLTFPLIAGQDIRDYYVGEFANSLNNGVAGVEAINAFTCTVPTTCQDNSGAAPAGSTFVFDEQHFSLGTAFAGQTLTQIVLTDTYNGSTPILMGVTVGAPSPIPASPNITSVVNAASFAHGSVASGSIVAVFGSFPVNAPSAASSVPWPASLSGLSLQFSDGGKAPLVYASDGQANIQIPWELEGRTQISLTATVNGQTSAPHTVSLVSSAPGIFTSNGQEAILDASYRLVDSSNPATPGSTIQIYCTGLGPVTNHPATGAPAGSDPLSMTKTTPVVTIGGVSAKVLFSGLAPGFVGVYQVNVQVPTSAPTGDEVPVVFSIGGVSSNTVTMAVQAPASLNPQPAITGLSPSSAQAGSGRLTLTINGSGFVPSSSVRFNGASHAPSFVNSGQLTIILSASDLATAGSLPVMVTNPSPGGGKSNIAQFTVSAVSVSVPPAPTGLSPGSTASPGVTVNTLTPTLIWNASPGATGYVVAMLNATTGTTILSQNISTTSIICPTLVNGATYVWSVEAYNSAGRNTEFTPLYFTVIIPVQTTLTGTWQGTWGSVPDPLAYGGLSASLTQNGTTVSGTVTLTYSSCVPGGDVSGTISGNTLSLGLYVGPPQPQAIFLGTVNASGNSILGTYAVYLGDCAGDYGVITLNRSN